MTETRSRDSYHDAPATGWAHRRTRAELTISEAEHWEAGRDACVEALRAIGARMRASVAGEDGVSAHVTRCSAAALDTAADACARLTPRPAPDGLSERGA